jgi:hypothetical protein
MDESAEARLFFLLPDLWTADEQVIFHTAEEAEEIADMVERRTGVRPVFSAQQIWAIVAPASDELLPLDDAAKAASLDQPETRPVPDWHRKEQHDAADDTDCTVGSTTPAG